MEQATGTFTLPMSNIYKLNGSPLPQPSAQSFDSEDIQTSDTGRTQTGYMIIKIVAYGKRSITIKYDLISQEQLSGILRMLHSPYYDFSYMDAEYGEHIIHCYNPGRKSDIYHAVLYNGIWRNAELTFIEA